MTAIHSAAEQGNETWRVGILFSRSGVTAVTESEHFFGTVLAIEEINARGGVRGRLLDPVVFDPQGDLGAYRRLASQMLSREGVNVIFGCSTSSSRKAVLPELERKNGLLWYCSLYEGFEYSPNVVYTGAVPNQNSLQLAAYLLKNCGKRMYLIGSDYIYPRESNRIMRDFFERHGGEIVDEIYLPFDVRHEEIEAAVYDIYRDRPEAVFSTVIGRPARDFYRVLHDAGRAEKRLPVASLTLGETELKLIGPQYCAGHIVSATYFSSLPSEQNQRFLASYRRRFGADATVSAWGQAAYNQVYLFAGALERAGSMDTQKLVDAVFDERFDAPEGAIAVDPENHHVWLQPKIGVARDDGAFDVVWQAAEPVKPDPYLTTYEFSEFWLK
ncbi:transporter substrate-binding domain-containing protein [Duganella sp. Dugasp56]|uniref:transporter substrate-binding domain-containing protein n=1 Tax=Duganella sp. Dugasp56 TaxID=3243046 RepID=UPI0039AFB216